jgi:hypothetical protein
MNYSKPIAIALTAVVCAVSAADAGAQSRDRATRRGPTVGHAVPRGGEPRAEGPRGPSPRSYGGREYSRRYIVPHRPYYYPYRSRLSLGFYAGYPFGYPSAYPYAYGYPYGAYAYPYGGYPYGGYGYDGYGYAAPLGYRGSVYGGVRIQGASRNAEVYVDGYYAGIVDDFDGAFQRLELDSGAHEIEIRAPGLPPLTYDVNVEPGQTITIHANVR